jgi:membrane-associated phospholipid phosphatase
MSSHAPLSLGIAVAAVGSAAVIGRMAATGRTRELDHACQRQMRRVRTKPLERIAEIASISGEPGAQLPLAVLAGLAIVHRSSHDESGRRRKLDGRTWIAASRPLFASLAAIATHHVIKLVYKRRRPIRARLHGKTEPSFPSGHTTVTTATVGASVYALVRHRVISADVAPFALIVPVGVGLSRLYLDKHWATDVIGGFLIGVGITAGSATFGDTAAHPASASSVNLRSTPSRSRNSPRRETRPH